MDRTTLWQCIAGLSALVLVGSAAVALAEATVPTSDIDGSADNPIVKRYEGSFIVSYEKLAYTDITVPLSPLKESADEDARDSSNNRVIEAEDAVDLEGALTRLAYVLPEDRSPLEVLRNYQDVVEEAGGSVLFECKQEDMRRGRHALKLRRRRGHEPHAVFLPRG